MREKIMTTAKYLLKKSEPIQAVEHNINKNQEGWIIKKVFCNFEEKCYSIVTFRTEQYLL